jgi:hypothetical protein
MEDAEVVRLLLDRGRHAGQLLEIVGDPARTGKRLEAALAARGRRRKLVADRGFRLADVDASPWACGNAVDPPWRSGRSRG